MNSGWHERYPDKKRVFNTETPSNTSTYHFPSWGEQAVSWLLSYRSVHVLGVDVPSLDYGQSPNYPVHILISRENIVGLENVGYLDKIPASGTIISCAPMKIVDGSGSPVRVYALVPHDDSDTSAALHHYPVLLLITICIIFARF